ncbi:Scaffold-type E3 ligase [Massospora cicadina]|nr:Scaffold-type E3 ligase [Massospora cicadina]
MEQYCADLQVDPTDVSMLILAWHLGAEQMCEFKWKGFVEGWQGLGLATLPDLKYLGPMLGKGQA